MAIQYLGTTVSGLAGDTKPTLTANELGVIFVETDTDKIYLWDGDSWNLTTAADATTAAKGVASVNCDNFANFWEHSLNLCEIKEPFNK